MRYASAYVLDAPYHADKPYEYYIPEALESEISEGSLVTVPFGGGNRYVNALVFSLSETCEYRSPKPILSVIDERFALGEEMRELILFMKERTLCTVGDAVRCLLPSAALSRTEQIFLPADGAPEPDSALSDLAHADLTVYSYIYEKGSATKTQLLSRFGKDAEGILARLCRKQYLSREYAIKEGETRKYTEELSLAVPADLARLIAGGAENVLPKLRGEKQRALLSVIADAPENRVAKSEALEKSGAAASQVSALLEKGLILLTRRETDRNPYASLCADPEKKNILSDEQREAYLTLCDLYHKEGAHAALLYGVTGSGKTRVMKAMIDEVVRDGRSVIVLVPEISLTPQTVRLFCSFYGERVAVLHSGLSAGERFDTWMRIRDGRVDVVIGTRSAVFAPLCNLGMIIMDEEQEHTYKSDADPRYHARDIARFRCARSGGLLLLASATPSVESFYRAKQGVYTLVCLRRRYGNAVLPSVHICDMRREVRDAHTSPLSRELLAEMRDRLSRDEQTILFLNRRGYNSFVHCRDCGETIQCPHCSVSLTCHKEANGQDVLRCHYCGYQTPTPKVCPSCGSDRMSRMGVGTQKAAEEAALYLPAARLSRLDADTATTKHAYDEILDGFRDHKADVLIGTQMVTKGHDFPDVTLVGVLNADASLSMDDFRANEHTFSLITQVVGRAGRADKPGIAVVQSYKPDSEALLLSCHGDYEEFYEHELTLRRTYIWPPFCNMTLMTLTAANERDVRKGAEILKSAFAEEARKLPKTHPVIAYGPFEAPIYKVNEKYRMRMVIKTRLNRETRAMFSALLYRFSAGAGSKAVSLTIDFDPSAI